MRRRGGKSGVTSIRGFSSLPPSSADTIWCPAEVLMLYGALSAPSLPRKMISKCRRSGPHTSDLSLLRALSGILVEVDGVLFLWADQEDINLVGH